MDKKTILECIRNAEENPSDVDRNILSGFSGAKIISLLKNFASTIVNDRATYLEVGVYRGLTLLSVAATVPESEVFGIDNFAFFDKYGINLSIIRERMTKLNIQNATIINNDFEDALENLDRYTGDIKTGLYFIDGPHDYRSQLMSLLLIRPWLTESAVIIVDDSNYLHVRQANRDFLIINPEFKLVFQSYTKVHPQNCSAKEREEAESGWWNGINVIVRDPDNIFEPFLPPTMPDKTLFTNDHHIHTSMYPEAFRKYSRIVDLIASCRLRKPAMKLKGKYKSMNTYSDDLTYDHFNPSFFSNIVQVNDKN